MEDCSRLEVTWQLNATHDPGLDPDFEGRGRLEDIFWQLGMSEYGVDTKWCDRVNVNSLSAVTVLGFVSKYFFLEVCQCRHTHFKKCMYIHYIYIHIITHVHCVLSHLSRVQFFAALWIVAHQTPLSMEFSRQECWRGLPYPLSGESSQPRDQTHVSLHLPALAGGFFTTGTTWEAPTLVFT